MALWGPARQVITGFGGVALARVTPPPGATPRRQAPHEQNKKQPPVHIAARRFAPSRSSAPHVIRRPRRKVLSFIAAYATIIAKCPLAPALQRFLEVISANALPHRLVARFLGNFFAQKLISSIPIESQRLALQLGCAEFELGYVTPPALVLGVLKHLPGNPCTSHGWINIHAPPLHGFRCCSFQTERPNSPGPFERSPDPAMSFAIIVGDPPNLLGQGTRDVFLE